ncbi:acyltransferase [Yimella sp. cx-51]|uniref:acyltransferase family protein n=1 Tax=Yimella sp. cx-51 TaxID=2770551 RepID=UPI00165DD6FD|nr:acyltransferase [Yimella sp. cx-51]MBC9956109.1 acyltransferase [Yimella sp. cx-51]MBD2758275.1 acyltransferase [Yimella sp. cx-573]QTH37361.1 acyltransferase [Yimella sp. cx-51]
MRRATEPTPGPHRKRAELKALTGLRAVAALLVVLSHTHLPRNAPDAFDRLVGWGHMGVPLFFLLSGVVLGYNYPDLSPRNGRRTVLFYLARIARVMPLYWVMIVLWVLFYYAEGQQQRPWVLLQHLFAVQTWGDDVATAQFHYNGPGWSIGVELFFYALFPFIAPLIARAAWRWRTRGLVLIAGACAAFSLVLWAIFTLKGWTDLPATDGRSAHRWLYRNPLPNLAVFVGGVTLAHLLGESMRLPTRLHSVIQTGVVVYTLGLGMFHSTTSGAVKAGSFGAFFVLPFMLGIFSLASGRGWLARFLSTRLLVVLGASSYALYLTHRWFLWHLTSAKQIQTTPGLRGWAALLITLVILVAVAEGAHRLVENPARAGIMNFARRLKALHRRRKQSAMAVAQQRVPEQSVAAGKSSARR